MSCQMNASSFDILTPYYSPEAEQLIADLQSDSLGRGLVDLESNAVLYRDEVYDSANLSESVDLAHGQDAAVPDGCQNPWQVASFGCAYEQDVTLLVSFE